MCQVLSEMHSVHYNIEWPLPRVCDLVKDTSKQTIGKGYDQECYERSPWAEFDLLGVKVGGQGKRQQNNSTGRKDQI